ncbi:hypothetical protein FSP39_008721 [Pinctada imbricata]|uniref:Zinc finger protein ush n=1 Tax=Pinctada imbricata TaxID=66713 RepID=A0AA88XI52_PINIB|nr:hypothetical protein FSP39_008721 [Pinctada imbricata]
MKVLPVHHLEHSSYPDEVLFLKKVDDDDIIAASRPYLVCNSVPLSKGSCFGPFRGEVVSLSSIQQGDLVLQESVRNSSSDLVEKQISNLPVVGLSLKAQERDGETGFVRVLEETGAWLSLLRPALHDAAINSTVYFEGGNIWCEIVNELEAGSELLASFTINSKTVTSADDKIADDRFPAKMNATLRAKTSPSSPDEATKTMSRESSPSKSAVAHAALLYGCPYCGVRFSSSRTLQGHLTFYCSKKPPPSAMLSPRSDDGRGFLCETDRDSGSYLKRKQSPCPGNDETRLHETSGESQLETEGPPSKSLKTGEMFKCQMCSYSTDKQSSLNRHKRIHNRGETSPDESKNDTYCAKCNIQFSSYSTYRCHRDVYCPMRASPNDGASTPSSSPAIRSPNRELSDALHNGLPINLREAILHAASASGQARALLAHPGVVPSMVVNGDINFHSIPTSPGAKLQNNNHTRLNSDTIKDRKQSDEQPLDLSTNKSDEKNKRRSETSSPNTGTSKHEKQSDKVKVEPQSPGSPTSTINHQSVPISPNAKPSPSPSHSSGRSSEKPPIVPSPILPPAMPPLLAVHQFPFLGNMGKPIPPVPHAVSKCVDCNIVFYKRENFLIHKKHYCSSRRNKTPDSDDSNSQQPMSLGSSTSFTFHASKSDQESNSSDHEHSEKHSLKSESPRSPKTPKTDAESAASPLERSNSRSSIPDDMYRFYCIPCKIKFSSASTLKAHKEFYCPHGKESEHSIVVKKPSEDQGNSRDSEESNVRCERCDNIFASSRLLKHHLCPGISAQLPLTRCIYCDFVTQTEMRLHEHMKAHMPNKAYRCTLCGYRGNTVRGMRMHGKTHLDNGEEFTDENMIEIEEPPLMPIKLHGSIGPDAGPLDIEAELIRMKNEPYKRRRSRKSYEKAEYASSIPPPRTPISTSHFSNVCVFCGQMFTDISAFAMHLKIHEMMALQAASALENRSYRCQHCTYVAETMDNLFAHVCTKHPEKIPKELSASPKSQSTSPESSSFCSPTNARPESTGKETARSSTEEREQSLIVLKRIKSEPIDTCNENSCSSQSSALSKDLKQERLSDKGEDMHDNNENIPHERSNDAQNNEEKRSEEKCQISSPRTIKEEPEIRGDTVRSPLGNHMENKSTTSSPRSEKSPISRGSTPKSKPEMTNGVDRKCSPLVVPRMGHHMIPYYQLMPDFHFIQSSLPVSQGQTTLSGIPKGVKPTTKYCHHCDISFTYQATYLAHKKYYCSASRGDELSPPTKA